MWNFFRILTKSFQGTRKESDRKIDGIKTVNHIPREVGGWCNKGPKHPSNISTPDLKNL